MHRLLFAFVVVLAASAPAPALREAINVGAFSAGCPVIVRGTIASVERASDDDIRSKRPDDVAEIEITEVVKNELKDVPLKVGGTLKVRMVARNARRIASQPNYPEKTDGLWLVVLADDGEFRIDVRPEQRQPIDRKWSPETESRKKTGDDPKDEPGVVRGTITKAEWLKARADRRAEAKKREEQRLADERTVRELATFLADAGRIDATTMRKHQELKVDLRRDFFQLSGKDLPLSADLRAEAAAYVLKHEADDNVRTHAVRWLSPTAQVAALKDRSASVRLFACQALGFGGDKEHAAAVRALLTDPDAGVRQTAITALGRLGDKSVLPDLLKRYEAEQPGPDDSAAFADALARLGDDETAAAAAKRALGSDNWNVRWTALAALERVKVSLSLPVLMDALVPELLRVVAEREKHGVTDRNYARLCELLAARTGKNLGLDPLAWADWWATARKEFAAPELKFDREAAAKAFEAYKKK